MANKHPAFPSGNTSLKGGVLENEFYRVEVDPETGGVTSVFDKERKREQVDRKGAGKLNQYIYYSLTGSHEALYQDNHPRTHLGRVPTSWYNIGIYSPLAAKIEIGQEGPALKSLVSDIRMDHGLAPSHITQEVILYSGIKRIDFENRIHKQATLAKEEVYYAFPIDVPNFEINRELPGAVLRSFKDQLSGSFTGFSGIPHWAEASNGEFGVAARRPASPASRAGAHCAVPRDGGQPARVFWRGPAKPRQAQLCDMGERPIGRAAIQDDRVQFDMGPWQIVTIRVQP